MEFKKAFSVSSPSSSSCSDLFHLSSAAFWQRGCWKVCKVSWTSLPLRCKHSHWVPPGSEDNGNPMQFEGVMQFRRVLQFYAFRPGARIRVSVVYRSPPPHRQLNSSSRSVTEATSCVHKCTELEEVEYLFFSLPQKLQSLSLCQRSPPHTHTP